MKKERDWIELAYLIIRILYRKWKRRFK